jgi:hypothetical protein
MLLELIHIFKSHVIIDSMYYIKILGLTGDILAIRGNLQGNKKCE